MTQFKDRLTRFEFWSAMAMLPLHCVLLPRLLLVLNNVLNLGLSGARFNLLYYCMSFALVLVLLGRYLLRSWRNLAEKPGLCLMHFLTAWGLCLALNFAVNLLMLLISPSGSNPNQDTVNSLTAQDRSTMMAVAVLLAPVVEEAIFRGGIFCTIRRRSRIAASRNTGECANLFQYVDSKNPEYYNEFKNISYSEQERLLANEKAQDTTEMEETYGKIIQNLEKANSVFADIK